MFESWLDGFFVACAVFVGICSSIDWLIGQRGRIRMREWAGDFWRSLAEKPFRIVIVENIDQTSALIERVFGPRIKSWRRFFACLIYSAVTTFIASVLLHYVEPLIWERPEDAILYGLRKAFPATVVVDFLSFAIIVAVYRWATRWPDVFRVLAPVVSIICVSFVTAAIAISYFIIILMITSADCLGDACDEQEVEFLSFLGAFWVLMMTTTVPIILHLFHIFLIVLARVFRLIVRPAMMLVLLRLEESEKGVLTTVAIAIAALSKIVQEVLKHVGA